VRECIISSPVYWYSKKTFEEVDFYDKDAIWIMAVDTLPCELPRDASHQFWEMFLSSLLQELLSWKETERIQNATIAKDWHLTKKFEYLSSFVGE
jgi:hypothetical protein